jgi:hypothetical protein
LDQNILYLTEIYRFIFVDRIVFQEKDSGEVPIFREKSQYIGKIITSAE